MLTESQQNGIRELLSRFDQELILSIANTTTKKALVLTSIEEAVNAILLHSESVSWFLNRKKITRTLLFEYLSWKRIPISGQAEKHTIIEKVIELWDQIPNGNLVPKTESSMIPSQPINYNNLECSKPVEKPEMGLQFAQWFYGILLSIYNQSPFEGRLSDQFWNDGTIKITINTPGSVEQQNAVGSEEAANLIHTLIGNQNLLNPNLTTEGIREKKSPHGFTIIGVCGTVHHQGNCSGIFEQVFGLLQDPSSEFRWRIKWTELRMTQATVNRLPCVNDLPELQAICDSPHDV